MRTPLRGAPVAAGLALAVIGLLTGCASEDLDVGDCLRMGGPPDNPEATEVACGSPESNYKVAAIVQDGNNCPADVDSYYSMRSTFDDVTTTVCLDIDWVVGDCMSIDPTDETGPVRADCTDPAVPHLQRVTEILNDVAGVDQCVSGVGYAYADRQFTVCVEHVDG